MFSPEEKAFISLIIVGVLLGAVLVSSLIEGFRDWPVEMAIVLAAILLPIPIYLFSKYYKNKSEEKTRVSKINAFEAAKILRINAEEKAKILKINVFEAKFAKLQQSEDYDLIKNFGRIYKDKIILYLNNKFELNRKESEIESIKEILSRKGYLFSDDEIDLIIIRELEKQDYDDFRKKILSYNPESFGDYVRYFVSLHPDDYPKYVDKFKSLLKEKDIGSYDNGDRLLEDIKRIKRNIEIEILENRIKSAGGIHLTIESLDSMSGIEFERFLRLLFEKIGYYVEITKASGDQGADLILSRLGEKTIVQAKRYGNTVGNKAIQEVAAAIKHYNADKGLVVITSDFSRSAIELAKSNNVELIDRGKLKKLIEKYFL